MYHSSIIFVNRKNFFCDVIQKVVSDGSCSIFFYVAVPKSYRPCLRRPLTQPAQTKIKLINSKPHLSYKTQDQVQGFMENLYFRPGMYNNLL